ncbi:hypothetical protein JCM16163A_22490 [Paenibacillus sp. YK5]
MLFFVRNDQGRHVKIRFASLDIYLNVCRSANFPICNALFLEYTCSVSAPVLLIKRGIHLPYEPASLMRISEKSPMLIAACGKSGPKLPRSRIETAEGVE